MEAGLVQILEGALLAAGEPLSVQRMALLFEENERPSKDDIRAAIKTVEERCEDRGYELVQVASGYRFQVRQNLSTWVGRLWQERPARYSRALMETLSLIAYRQPITRGEIEEIRGVAVSTNIIKTLLEGQQDAVPSPDILSTVSPAPSSLKKFMPGLFREKLEEARKGEGEDVESLGPEADFGNPVSMYEKAPRKKGKSLSDFVLDVEFKF